MLPIGHFTKLNYFFFADKSLEKRYYNFYLKLFIQSFSLQNLGKFL